MSEEAVAEAETSTQEEKAVETEQQETRTVPLKAYEEERRKRQEAEYQATWVQQQWQAMQQKPQADDTVDDYEDDEEKQLERKLEQKIERRLQKQTEEAYLASRPEAAEIIKQKLPGILQKHKYLSAAIDNASNRYQAAMDIIERYAPQEDVSKQTQKVDEKLEKNQSMPGNPNGVPKTGSMSGLDRVKEMDRREFSLYRAKLRGRAPNIR